METDAALRKMRPHLARTGMPPEVLLAFERLYRAYRSGATGVIPWDELAPLQPGDLLQAGTMDEPGLKSLGRSRLGEVAWVVLNGGLGTSMKMDRAKSLVAVKGAETFLDLLAGHVADLRRRWARPIPLVFMNSFATRDDTLVALRRHELEVGGADGRPLPLEFTQHRYPRIREADGLAYGQADDSSSWAPPGHGDLFLALHTSGALERLLEAGIRWAFVSNADNLGASLHLGMLGYLASHECDFLMEVTRKTPADVKGGTLVRRGGRLTLLEHAQVADDHKDDFHDTARFPVFNTNNLWINLEAVDRRLREGTLELPLIVNRKLVGVEAVVQLETAMGAAIGVFARAKGVLVPRSRFAPVKTTDDLLVRRSDAYVRGDESPLRPNPARDAALGPPFVRLDPRFYGSVADLDLRMPDPPSLVAARSFEVVGDVRFGRGVTVAGEVRVENPRPISMAIADGTALTG